MIGSACRISDTKLSHLGLQLLHDATRLDRVVNGYGCLHAGRKELEKPLWRKEFGTVLVYRSEREVCLAGRPGTGDRSTVQEVLI